MNVHDDFEDIQNNPPSPPPKKVPSPSMVFFYGFAKFSDPNVLQTKRLGGTEEPCGGMVVGLGGLVSMVSWCLPTTAVTSPMPSHQSLLFGPLPSRTAPRGSRGYATSKLLLFCYMFRVWFFFFFGRSGFFLLGPGLPSRSPRAKDFKLVGRSHIILNSSLK